MKVKQRLIQVRPEKLFHQCTFTTRNNKGISTGETKLQQMDRKQRREPEMMNDS